MLRRGVLTPLIMSPSRRTPATWRGVRSLVCSSSRSAALTRRPPPPPRAPAAAGAPRAGSSLVRSGSLVFFGFALAGFTAWRRQPESQCPLARGAMLTHACAHASKQRRGDWQGARVARACVRGPAARVSQLWRLLTHARQAYLPPHAPPPPLPPPGAGFLNKEQVRAFERAWWLRLARVHAHRQAVAPVQQALRPAQRGLV